MAAASNTDAARGGRGASFIIGNQGNLIANAGVTVPNAITCHWRDEQHLELRKLHRGIFSGPITLNANVIVASR